MATLVLFNKPFQVLSQFTDARGRACLADYLSIPDIYPAGRLDWDSEGLLLLTDSGPLQARIAQPRHHMEKTYLVQVEGIPAEGELKRLRGGIELKDGPTLPARVTAIAPPDLWLRTPPVRERKSVPDSWLEIVISEGRNRQVRRMTAAIGHPTLRLVRWSVGPWSLAGLAPGQWRQEEVNLPRPASARRPRHRAGGAPPRNRRSRR